MPSLPSQNTITFKFADIISSGEIVGTFLPDQCAKFLYALPIGVPAMVRRNI